MDDLDREIEEAARLARRKVWRGRFATIASTATLLVVGSVGTVAVLQLFPEPAVDEFDAQQQEMKARHEEPGAMMLVHGYAAVRMDSARLRWKIAPVIAAAFASALFVSKRLKPDP